jgi:signal transduction histidine kinase
MRFQLKIAQKGLVVVIVPLVLEFALVLALEQTLAEAQIEVARQAHAHAVIEHANNLLRHIFETGMAEMVYALTHTPALKENARQSLRLLKQESSILADLTRDDPEQNGILQDLQQAVVKIFKQIRAAPLHNTNLFSVLARKDEFMNMQRGMWQADASINKLLGKEWAIEEQGPSRHSRARQQIKAILLSAVVVSIILSLLLGGYFSAGITRRLLALTDNTVRLLKEQPLRPRMRGTDEVTELDQVFHDMASQLDRSRALKQRLVELLSGRLREPLQLVDTLLDELLRGEAGVLPGGAAKKLQMAEADVVRLLSLINDLVQAHHVEAGKLEMRLADTPLSSIIERSLAAVGDFAGARKIRITASEAKVWVHADANRLIQVLINLLSNAVKFSPPGGTVHIDVNELPDAVEISVSDQGRGIPAHLQAVVFERYRQVEPGDAVQKGGTGLGLSVCKTIIEQHDGSIGLLSTEGSGSTFWFRVSPGKSPDATNNSLSDSTGSAGAGNSRPDSHS